MPQNHQNTKSHKKNYATKTPKHETPQKNLVGFSVFRDLVAKKII